MRSIFEWVAAASSHFLRFLPFIIIITLISNLFIAICEKKLLRNRLIVALRQVYVISVSSNLLYFVAAVSEIVENVRVLHCMRHGAPTMVPLSMDLFHSSQRQGYKR